MPRDLATMETTELQPPELPQLLLDNDDADEREWGSQDDDELQEMMASLSWTLEAARSPHGKSRRRARNDRYDELEFMRNKVHQMEEELRTLRLQHLDYLVPLPVSSPPAATLAFSSQMFGFPVPSPTAPPTWDIAARQQRWRERAACENNRLRMVLDTQASLARRLESQMGKRIRDQLTSQALPFSNFSGKTALDRGPSFELETETVESLRIGLNTALEELDSVFDTNGLDRVEPPSTDARIREDVSGMYLDIFATKLLPFDFETTATATWNHYRGVERRRGNLNQNLTLADESDTVMEEVAMKFTGKSTNADFRVKQALQRHVEPDRQVVVWVSKAEAVEQQISAYSNFGFVDKGYVVVKRPKFPEQGQTASTLLQICCLISPQMVRGCVLDVNTSGEFTEFVLSVMVASITATQELVESMLLKEAHQLLQQRDKEASLA
ncbi:hypothetical protein F441_12836 [Phytophthora nicotianae CJ01A1]|uniref:M96 mating-specific protein family n=5 Tax=Phytophthora nicotianae TaxID=4792 RepID=W2R552_PHYN3|nr:hypothetical protein PPTG_02966 [Phytophthora nicotianae INRA-310]ETI41924.1 hypothetical protein F443_12869 [Phytophthora nicotianae P1569]ETK81955.1 hypothetical protein L915_12577 [Phytophthora nicotianae]ETP11653.1 hypothetical protein F441_12836 [Phytophthora nicotianae CJ01A1]ETL35361.1 hypothetical protein L916_12486 [Phytophthora nicotianae]ETL88598.1 hypothetical protein L917_12325 [Phytophthora nicotianae]